MTFIPRKDHEKAEFEVHEVYAVDVLISSGEGKVSVLFTFQIAADYTFLLELITCFACLSLKIRLEMEVWGPPFIRETLVSSMDWRWKLPVRSSVKWNDALMPCPSLWGMNIALCLKLLHLSVVWLKHLIAPSIFHQGIWRWGQSPSGCGGVCQTWTATALQCAAWERRSVRTTGCNMFVPYNTFHLSMTTSLFRWLCSQESLLHSLSSQCCWWPMGLTESPADPLIQSSTSQSMKFRIQSLGYDCQVTTFTWISFIMLKQAA